MQALKNLLSFKGSRESRAARRKREQESGEGGGGWLRLGVGVLLLALMLGGAFQALFLFWEGWSGSLYSADVKSESTMKDIFFSGSPWLAYCNGSPYSEKVPAVMRGITKLLWEEEVRLVSLRCDEPLPSGKSITTRFRLPPSTVAFVVANGHLPVAIPLTTAVDQAALYKFVVERSRPKVKKIKRAGEFGKVCLSGESCVVIGTDGPPREDFHESVVLKVMAAKGLRVVRVVAIDKSEHKLLLDDALIAQRTKKGPIDLVCLKNLSNPKDPKKKDHAGSFFTGDVADAKAVRAFFTTCRNGSPDKAPFVPLKKQPKAVQREKPKATRAPKEKKGPLDDLPPELREMADYLSTMEVEDDDADGDKNAEDVYMEDD